MIVPQLLALQLLPHPFLLLLLLLRLLPLLPAAVPMLLLPLRLRPLLLLPLHALLLLLLLLRLLARLRQVAVLAARFSGRGPRLAHPPRLLIGSHRAQHRPHVAAAVDAAGKGAAHAAPGAVHVLIQQLQAAARE